MNAYAQAPVAGSLSALPLRRDTADDAATGSACIFLALLAAAAVAAVWYRRRRKVGGADGPGLARVESLTLTSQASLHVVRWGQEELLIGCGQGAVDVLSRRAVAPQPQGKAS
jgi:MYXO-CTERM domain-containing protein